jgi:catechol 2,3-dioxygenase-like lactoylglutathione lyase family enzyme
MTRLNRRSFVAMAALAFAACASPAATDGPAAAPQASPAEYSGPLVRGVAWVGIAVTDLDRSTAFYQQATSLKVVDETPIRGNAALNAVAGRRGLEARTRLLRGTNAQLRLMQFSSPSKAARAAGVVPVNGPGITHVCHQSPDDRPIFPKPAASPCRAPATLSSCGRMFRSSTPICATATASCSRSSS